MAETDKKELYQREEKFLQTPADQQVDADAIRAREFRNGVVNGALKWGGYSAAAMAATVAAVVLTGGVSGVVGLAIFSLWEGVTLSSVVMAAAGITAAAAVVGAIAGGGQASAEGDEKVREEIDKVARAQDRIRMNQLEREQLALQQKSMAIQYQKQLLSARAQSDAQTQQNFNAADQALGLAPAAQRQAGGGVGM